MKKLILISLALGGFFACSKNNTRQLTSAEISAVDSMNYFYANAVRYNDSFINLRKSNGNEGSIYITEMLYHQCLDSFERIHESYGHDEYSADHSHDNGMMTMHSSNKMMKNKCGCCGNGGHAADIHTKMNNLAAEHLPYCLKK